MTLQINDSPTTISIAENRVVVIIDDGRIGPPGPQGATGPAGATGATGPQGPAGADATLSSDGSVTDIIALTQVEYDAIVTPDATTLYVITD